MTRHPDQLAHTLAQSNDWLDEIQALARWRDRPRALAALRATLHAVRDRLDHEHVTRLGAELPLLVRSVYYDGWIPGGYPRHVRNLEGFLALVGRDYPGDDVERAARAVLIVLSKHIPARLVGELEHALPPALSGLWPAPLHREIAAG